MKQGLTTQEFAAKIKHYADHAVDVVLEPDTMTADSNGDLLVPGHGWVTPTKHAHRQTAAKLGINYRYYEHMLGTPEHQKLWSVNVNHMLRHNPGERMVRMIKRGNVAVMRANLSNAYKRIDNGPVFETAAGPIADMGGVMLSQNVDIDRMHAKVVFPTFTYDIAPGDPMQFGIMLRNGETGMHMAEVRIFSYRDYCTNGCVFGLKHLQAYSRRHVGKRQQVGQLENANDMELDDVRTMVRESVSEPTFMRIVKDLRESMRRTIHAQPEQVVERSARVLGVTKLEQEGVLKHLQEGGDLTQWGLLNAITRTAQDAPTYQRATELETIGGQVLELNARQWNAIALAA